MKKVLLTIVLVLLLGVGCQSDAPEAAAPIAEEGVVGETAVSAEPTPEPEPTVEPTPAPTLITSANELAGIWEGVIAGERGYVMYTENGRYYVSLSRDSLTATPRVSGDYWFENDQIHLRDTDNLGHWAECDAATIGVYEVIVQDDGKVKFETVEDGCNEGGFTRNYVFGNMIQEWREEPAEIVPPEAMEEKETLPELAEALQAIADTWVNENGVPSFALLVEAPDLNFKWKGAAGMANPEEGVPMIADDQFIISSGTKMYTGVTIVKLAEQGKLNLDDPISLYVPEEIVARIHVVDGESYGETITIRQLLTHTSGLGDFSNGPDNDESGLPDFKDLVLAEPDQMWDEMMVLEWAIANAPPVAQPGEMFNYSDTNYQLLGLVIEKASGMALHEAYRQLIFEPLGMEHTFFEFRDEAVAGVDGRPVSNAYYHGTLWNALDSHSYEWGSGGLVSTVEDQNRFLWAWAKGDLFDDPASKEVMLETVTTPNPGGYYGLGVWHFVLDEWDIPGLGTLQGHGGLPNSHAHYWPEQNVTIVGTLNSNEPDLGFIGVLIEVMFTVQGFAGG